MNKQRKICIAIVFLCIVCLFLCGFATHNTWTFLQTKAHEIAEIARDMGLPETDPIIVRAQEIWNSEQENKFSTISRTEETEHVSFDSSKSESLENEFDHAEAVDASESTGLLNVCETEVPEAILNDISELEIDDEASEEVKEAAIRYTLGVPVYTQQDIDIVASVTYNESAYGTTRRHKELVAGCVVNRVNCPWLGDTIYEVVCWPGQYLKAYATYDSYYMNLAMESDMWDECCEIAEKALKGEVDIPYDVIFQAEFPQGRGNYEIHETSYSKTYFCYSLYEFEDPLIAAKESGLVE